VFPVRPKNLQIQDKMDGAGAGWDSAGS
jgi:hypothetical protein